ncbi:unnamed protein product [Urochloa humidicola]
MTSATGNPGDNVRHEEPTAKRSPGDDDLIQGRTPSVPGPGWGQGAAAPHRSAVRREKVRLGARSRRRKQRRDLDIF